MKNKLNWPLTDNAAGREWAGVGLNGTGRDGSDIQSDGMGREWD